MDTASINPDSAHEANSPKRTRTKGKGQNGPIDPQIAAETARIGEETARVFARNLLANPEALAYVEARGISQALVEAGQVGICPPLFDYDRMVLLKGRLCVPIRDQHGRIVAFAGRQYAPFWPSVERAYWSMYKGRESMAEQRCQQWQNGKWINEVYAKNRHLFNLDQAKAHCRRLNYVVVVEGYFDALVLAAKGLPNVVAVCGVALSERHTASLARYCEHVVLMLDGDVEGDKGQGRMRERLTAAGLAAHSVRLPDGMDPDEAALKWGGKPLRRAIEAMLTQGAERLTLGD